MSEEAPDQEFVNMLWKWFEDRGVDLGPERVDGLTAEDFRIMLEEHEIALDRTDDIERLREVAIEARDFIAGMVKPAAPGIHTISSYHPCHALVDKINAALGNQQATPEK